MHKLLPLVALGLIFSLAACKKEEKGKTKNGNEYTLFHLGKKDGKKPAEDMFCQVHMYTYLNDSLMQSTRKMGEPEYIPIPTVCSQHQQWL